MTDVPDKMHAVVLTGHGGLDCYEYREDWPTPQPGPDEVLIKVHACGLNNTDVNTRTGWYSCKKNPRLSGSGRDTFTNAGSPCRISPSSRLAM